MQDVVEAMLITQGVLALWFVLFPVEKEERVTLKFLEISRG
jgi:hypothetical protein